MAAPLGNTYAAKDRDWRAHLKWALNQYENDKVKRGDALKEIATVVVTLALEGNFDAIHEIGNRLDGKPTRMINVKGSVEHRHINEMTDAELLAIIASEREGTVEKEPSTGEPLGVHNFYDA